MAMIEEGATYVKITPTGATKRRTVARISGTDKDDDVWFRDERGRPAIIGYDRFRKWMKGARELKGERGGLERPR